MCCWPATAASSTQQLPASKPMHEVSPYGPPCRSTAAAAGWRRTPAHCASICAQAACCRSGDIGRKSGRHVGECVAARHKDRHFAVGDTAVSEPASIANTCNGAVQQGQETSSRQGRQAARRNGYSRYQARRPASCLMAPAQACGNGRPSSDPPQHTALPFVRTPHVTRVPAVTWENVMPGTSNGVFFVVVLPSPSPPVSCD